MDLSSPTANQLATSFGWNRNLRTADRLSSVLCDQTLQAPSCSVRETTVLQLLQPVSEDRNEKLLAEALGAGATERLASRSRKGRTCPIAGREAIFLLISVSAGGFVSGVSMLPTSLAAWTVPLCLGKQSRE